MDFPVTEFGAVADGVTDSAPAIQRAVDAAHAAGGGRVVVPNGAQIRAGSFELKSGVDFHVAEGAVLLSATDLSAFKHKVFGNGEEAYKRLWIGARHACDITLSGTIANVVFRNVRCDSENGVVIWSDPPGHIHGLRFENVELKSRHGETEG